MNLFVQFVGEIVIQYLDKKSGGKVSRTIESASEHIEKKHDIHMKKVERKEDCSTWNMFRSVFGSSCTSCAADRPFGNTQCVRSVEKRADNRRSFGNGAKARAEITPAEKLSTNSRRPPSI